MTGQPQPRYGRHTSFFFYLVPVKEVQQEESDNVVLQGTDHFVEFSVIDRIDEFLLSSGEGLRYNSSQADSMMIGESSTSTCLQRGHISLVHIMPDLIYAVSETGRLLQ